MMIMIKKQPEQHDSPRYWSHLFFDHLTEKCAFSARGDKQHHKVLYRTGQYYPRQQPQRAR